MIGTERHPQLDFRLPAGAAKDDPIALGDQHGHARPVGLRHMIEHLRVAGNRGVRRRRRDNAE